MNRDTDVMGLDNLEAKVVTKRPPTEEELTAMRFNWRVVKQVHSNAIVFGGTDRTLGIGAGQMSRVDSARICRPEGRAGRPGSEGQRCGVRRHVPVCRRPSGGD
nr:hypothetical protein [Akkermansia muciniphila]